MADGRPFKTSTGKAPQTSAEELPAPPAGVGIVSALKTGLPLETPSQEVDEGRAHGHSAVIPWGPLSGTDATHKPMKLK